MANNREISQFASLVTVHDSNKNIAIGTGGTSNVGIGVTFPEFKLDVAGDGNFIGTVTALRFFGDGSQLTGVSASGGGSGEIFIQEEGTQVGGAVTTINIVGPRITAINSSVGVATITVDVDEFPTGDYGDLNSVTTDAFGVALSYAFDCLAQPQYLITTFDLQVLT